VSERVIGREDHGSTVVEVVICGRFNLGHKFDGRVLRVESAGRGQEVDEARKANLNKRPVRGLNLAGCLK